MNVKEYLARQPNKRTGVKEQDIVRAILQALTTQLGVFCWRNQSGVIPIQGKEKTRYIHASAKGSPDILGILPYGKCFGLEVKTPRGKVSAAQDAFGTRMVKLGAHYDIVRSVGEAVDAVRLWRNQ